MFNSWKEVSQSCWKRGRKAADGGKKEARKRNKKADDLAKKALDKKAKKIQVIAKATKKIKERAKKNIKNMAVKKQNLKCKVAPTFAGAPFM